MLSVIVDDTRDPVRNLALDEALVRAEAPAPLLRVWQNDPSVIIGRFQHAAVAVDMASCARDGIPVLRRATGGDAVYTGPGSLNVTLVVPRPGSGPGTERALGGQALDGLLATAVESLRMDRSDRGGVILSAGLRTRRRLLLHTIVPSPPTGPPVNLDAVRAALVAAVVERYGFACTRLPNPQERRWRDHLMATRYGDIAWHLSAPRTLRRSQLAS